MEIGMNKKTIIINYNSNLVMQIQQSWLALKQPVWIHRNQQFTKGIIKQIYKDIITCILQNGDSIKVKRNQIYHRNPIPIESSRTDLMQNDIINEPQILQHLTQRFLKKKIYTFVENTLIAVNPYSPIPELYTEQVKDIYIEKVILSSGNIKDQQPHIYAITAQMVKSLFEDKKDQAIIISGQSGAGKTEVNKECLRFLARYFSKNHEHLKNQNIERAIMLSNPILQAFGNSKTIRNNNSSRFGKYLSIMIDSNTRQIKHAQIYNYLLEKSRIISRSKEEQNFHIFYQFLFKTSTTEKVKYFLIDQETNQQLTYQNFNYTKNQTQKQYKAQAQISFQKIKTSLTILPDPKSYDYLCRILSAVLHLGNLQPFEDESSDYCQIQPKQSLQTICYLLQVDRKFLYDSLTSHNVKIGGQQLEKHFSKRQVQQLIHSLSKTLYQRLFQWIINQINKSTKPKHDEQQQLISLGFLDIYGFEVLKVNSLEQLFINYTNQRLHQIYLQKIFKLERQNFISEKLQKKFKQVEFQDNIKVIQLIDYDQLSIFNLLDQWCAVATPDEGTLITKIRFNHKKHQKFPSSNLNLLSTQFVIRHTPQDIQYSVVGFRQKNKDLLRQQIKATMRSSNLKILNNMFNDPKLQGEITDSKDHKIRKFLSSKFRKQMNELILDLLQKTQQHFIRCIKSNGNKKPLQIQQQIVYSQIKYLGILDTIKIKKMGYCIKIKYEDIDKRFPWLVRKQIAKQATHQQSISALKSFLPKFGEQQMLYGQSKIFFRDYSFNILMKKYTKHIQLLQKKAHLITTIFIKIRYIRKRNRRKKNKQIISQYLRGLLEQKKYEREISNIKKVQKFIKSYLIYKSSAKKLESILVFQSYIKRNIQSKLRIKRMNLLEKVILKFKSLKFKKKVISKLVANYIYQNYIFEKTWTDLNHKNSLIIQRYIKGFIIKITKKQKILEAFRNERNAIEGRSLEMIEEYLVGFSAIITLHVKMTHIKKIQTNIRTFIIGKNFKMLRKKIILVQKCIRQYIFRKKGAKRMFEKTYSSYEQELKIQNKIIQNKLFDNELGYATGMNANIFKFLGKFKDKISLIYYIIDLQVFVDLDIIYPNQSWLSNYNQIFQQGLQKNDPVQYLEVGQTFTVAASTSKVFIWGMHDGCKKSQYDTIFTKKPKIPIESISIHKNELKQNYMRDQENDKRYQAKYRVYETVTKSYKLQNGRIYQRLPNEFRLIKEITINQRVLQVSCGKAHTIFRTTYKKVYTLGNGREGQLGHSSFTSEQKPRSIKFFQNIKTFHVIQVSASFTSSIVLLSNHKVYWFGKNGTLPEVSTPTLFDLKSKCQIMNNNQFSVGRILSSWTRTMSVIGLTVLCYNKKFQNNIALRNKITDILFTKWQEVGINNINPPVIASVSDNLQQCHVKLRNKKINIYPESKTILKEMQQKVKSIASITSGLDGLNNRNSIGTEFSFANTQNNSIFK